MLFPLLSPQMLGRGFPHVVELSGMVSAYGTRSIPRNRGDLRGLSPLSQGVKKVIVSHFEQNVKPTSRLGGGFPAVFCSYPPAVFSDMSHVSPSCSLSNSCLFHSTMSSLAHHEKIQALNRKKLAWYATAVFVVVLGGSFALVPLYEVFCQDSGYGGLTQVQTECKPPPDENSPLAQRLIRIEFSGTVSYLPWSFKPAQRSLVVTPGETALAFYSAKNLSDKPIIGLHQYISTGNNFVWT
eukprot:GHVQ01025854.1.p1 GENE.GHVQ01025854.1~~GHVQ01025854.1.p1  ORF type:complete len:240 (+),score=20.75 GHVQ01025854.1:443-1162(+)